MSADVARKITAIYPQTFSRLKAAIADWALAEDCLQDAVEKALLQWPSNMPDNPSAWLITVAKNRAIDVFRREGKSTSLDQQDGESEQIAALISEEDLSEQALRQTYRDDVLRLIFTVCHPALNEETRLALTLKQVMGFNLEAVANALLVTPKTMEQRLTRAKKKIQGAGIPFEIPPAKQIPDRMKSVMTVVYLIFNEGYSATQGDALVRQDLCNEAIRLARLLQTLVKANAELIGLLALLLNIDARRHARQDEDGQLILLEQQDRSLWHTSQIAEAQVLLQKAMQFEQPGPYQIQAAIASLHNQAASAKQTDWHQIRLLYQSLMRFQRTPIVELNFAVALAKSSDLRMGYQTVCALEEQLPNYVPMFAAKAGLAFELGLYDVAASAYEQAKALSQSEPERQFFSAQMERIRELVAQ